MLHMINRIISDILWRNKNIENIFISKHIYSIFVVTNIHYINILITKLNLISQIEAFNVINISFFRDDADFEDICIVERLFSSSLVAIVSLKSPRTLTVCHFRKGTEICNYSYSNTILAVKLNRAVSYSNYCLHSFSSLFQ